ISGCLDGEELQTAIREALYPEPPPRYDFCQADRQPVRGATSLNPLTMNQHRHGSGVLEGPFGHSIRHHPGRLEPSEPCTFPWKSPRSTTDSSAVRIQQLVR